MKLFSRHFHRIQAVRQCTFALLVLVAPAGLSGGSPPVQSRPIGRPDGELIQSADALTVPVLTESGEAPAAVKSNSARLGWPATSAWKVAAPSPIRRFESYGFSYGGKLYIMGGWADQNFDSTTRVDVYDPARNTWTRLHDMQAPETHAGVAVDAVRGVVYFVAGHRGKYPSVPTRELWRYTIATDSWTKLHAVLPYPMGANNAALVGNELHSFGGNYYDRVTNTPDHFVIDLRNVDGGFTKKKPFPSARDHLAHVVIGDKILAVGGEFGHDKIHDQQSLLHYFDSTADRWVRLANMPVPKSHAESSTFLLDGKIIFAGGQSSPQVPTSSVYAYDPATNHWSALASLPAARQGTTVQKVGDYFVVAVGGVQTYQPQNTTWVAKAP